MVDVNYVLPGAGLWQMERSSDWMLHHRSQSDRSITMKVPLVLNAMAAACVFCAATLFPAGSSVAASPAPAALDGEGDGAIMMGVAVAAATQTIERQRIDRVALKKQLQHLLDTSMYLSSDMTRRDNTSRIVRIVFDVGPDGRTTNVRIGKRSGSGFTDRSARSMVTQFKGLTGGERLRVCAVLQYGRSGQDPTELVFIKARKDATDSAIADLLAGRDGPSYDRHGRIVT